MLKNQRWRTNAVELMKRLARAYQRIGRLRAIKREVFAALAESQARVQRRDAALQVQVDHAWAMTNKANRLEQELKDMRQLAVDELAAQQALIDAMDTTKLFEEEEGLDYVDRNFSNERHAAIDKARAELAKVKARTC